MDVMELNDLKLDVKRSLVRRLSKEVERLNRHPSLRESLSGGRYDFVVEEPARVNIPAMLKEPITVSYTTRRKRKDGRKDAVGVVEINEFNTSTLSLSGHAHEWQYARAARAIDKVVHAVAHEHLVPYSFELHSTFY